MLRVTIIIAGFLLAAGLSRARAAEIVILDDGRTIQAEKTEIIGDRLRIEKPAGIIEVPRSSVLSIHPAAPPVASPAPGAPAAVSGTSPAPSAPAEVYGNMTQQMNDQVRQEIQRAQTPARH
jgi:hypothetical protein